MNQFKQLSPKDKAQYVAIILLYPLIMLFTQLGKVCKLFSTRCRQLTASLLSVAVILTMLPVMSFTAFGEETTHKVTVNGGEYGTLYKDGTEVAGNKTTIDVKHGEKIPSGYTFVANEGYSIKDFEVQAKAKVIDINAGYYHTVVLLDNGTVWAVGSNDKGQLGDGTNEAKNTFTQMKDKNGYITDVKAISAGNYYTVALKNDGTVWAVGANNQGQLGDGTNVNKNIFIKSKNIADVKAISAGNAHTVVLKNDGTVWAVGANTAGQLGFDFNYDQTMYIKSKNITDVKAVSAGVSHTVALKNDGTVWATGYNSNGELGNNTTTKSSVFIKSQGVSDIKAISAGNSYTVALKNDGTVWATGENDVGQLGNGTNSNKLTFVKSKNISNIKAICAGDSHTLALGTSGTVWAVGGNYYGQLGFAPGYDKLQFISVSGLNDIKAISAGGPHTVALGNDSTVWGIGYNYHGQLGNGTNKNGCVPIQSDISMFDSIISATSRPSVFDTVVTEDMTITAKYKKLADISLSASKSEITYGESISLTATLTNSTALKENEIDFYCDDVKLGSALTDDLGVATFTVTKPNAGSYTYTAKFVDASNESSSNTTVVKVNSNALTAADVTISGIEADYIYDGNTHKPEPTVNLGKALLSKGTDYTISYGENIKIGKGTAVIEFIGNYSGSIDLEFTISYGTATADMYELPSANTNGWYNYSKPITAKSGYQIGNTSTEFGSSIDMVYEGENCSQEFYLQSTDGKVYKANISYNMDYSNPDVDIVVKENSIKAFINAITFGVFCKNTADVKIISSDNISDIDKTEYQIVNSRDDYDKNGTWTAGTSFSLNANKKCFIYARATDNAGNQTIEYSHGTVVYTDSEAYDKSVTFVKKSTENVSAKVKLNGNTVSYIKIDGQQLLYDYYTVSSEKPDTIVLHTDYLNTLDNNTHTVTVYYNPMNEKATNTSSDTTIILVDGEPATTTFELIVTNKVLSKEDFIYTPPTELTYDGTAKTVSVKYKSITDGNNLTIEYWNGETKLPSAPTDAGTYTVKVSAGETENYASVKSLTVGTFTIKKAEQSKPVTVLADNTTTLQNNDGKLTGVTSAMEYQKSGDSGWTAIGSSTVTGLSDGTYLVRFAENKNHNASSAAEITIVKFTGTKETTPSAVFTAANRELSNINSKQMYRIDGGKWMAVASDLSGIVSKACTIEIYMPGDGVYTLDSDIQKISVTKAQSPSLGKTDETIKNKADGTITGTDTAIEQLINGSWTSKLNTDNLAPGKYEFRVKAKGSVLESDSVSITIGEGRMLTVTTSTGSEYTINATGSKSVAYNGSFSFNVSVKSGYNAENMVVKANSAILSAQNGIYTVNGIMSDTSITVSGIIDNILPTAEMKIGNNTFNQVLNGITFGLFFKETQTVTVTAEDKEGSGINKTYYYLASGETNDFTNVKWTEFTSSFNINPNNKYVVYIKAVDNAKNDIIINSDGIVLDNIAPQLSVIDGKTYCSAVDVIVTEDNIDTITFNKEIIKPTDGKFTVSPKKGTQTIVVTDKAGNETTATITVNDGHTWDDGKITTEPTTTEKGVKTYTCTVCSEVKTEEIDKLPPSITEGKNTIYTEGGKEGLTFKSNAALADLESVSVDGKVIDKTNYTTKEGSTIVTLTADYLATLSLGKHTLAINSTTGTASTEFTIVSKVADPAKPGDTNSPQTGDTSNMVFWLALLLISGGALSALGISKKLKKAHRNNP